VLTVLALAAFVAGATGSWSPCGFSMISTLGQGPDGRRGSIAACAAFVPGALLGGVVTFGGLALLGALLGGGAVALAAGAVLAGAAALAEAAGVRIAPQIRRQVPEHWRRVLPLPLAAAGYGVLLGLGFTTFVLTFAVPALAGVALAVGDPAAGLVAGLAFGAGRALPVVVLAPQADRPFGLRATELMAERPAILRGFRVADALALAAVAVALGTESAGAQTRVAAPATDPSADGGDVVWHVPGAVSPFDGARPAVGDGLLARIRGAEVVVTRRSDGAVVRAVPAGDVTGVAVSLGWLVVRRGTTQLRATRLADGATRTVYRATAPVQVGRPSLDGSRLAFHVSGRTASRIVLADLGTGALRTLLSARRRQLTNPSLLGDALLYVETSPLSQQLRLGGRTLLRIAPEIRADRGYTRGRRPHRRLDTPARPRDTSPGAVTTLWTTALAADAAYVTRLVTSGQTTRAEVLRIPR